jgi:predicted HD superfamily hydrolase involved in NAD metabolism
LRQEYRYAHSVRVARTADRLAQAHGIDPRQARCAGMLHDIARLWPVERLLDECRARGLPLDRFEEEHPIVLHARIGALLAEERFGVTDRAVLSAITKHTVADPVMTPLDAIIFVADATEPGRQFALRAEILEVALRDLETGLAAVYTSTRESLERHGLPPSPALLTVPRLTK